MFIWQTAFWAYFFAWRKNNNNNNNYLSLRETTVQLGWHDVEHVEEQADAVTVHFGAHEHDDSFVELALNESCTTSITLQQQKE